jgi:hypothetical protein
MLFTSTKSKTIVPNDLRLSIENIYAFNDALKNLLLAYCGLQNNSRVSNVILKDIFLALTVIRCGRMENNALAIKLEAMLQNKKLPLGWQGILRFLPTSGSRYFTRSIPIEFMLSKNIIKYIEDRLNSSGESNLQLSIETISRELVSTRGSKSEPYYANFPSDNSRNFILGNYFKDCSGQELVIKHNCKNNDINTSLALAHIFCFKVSRLEESSLDQVVGAVVEHELDKIDFHTNLNLSFDFFLCNNRDPNSASEKVRTEKVNSNDQQQKKPSINEESLGSFKNSDLEYIFNKYLSKFENHLLTRVNNIIENKLTLSPV